MSASPPIPVDGLIVAESPELYWLPKAEWQILGHLTFHEDWVSEKMLLIRWFRLVYRITKETGRSQDKVMWFLRRECGKGGGHVHLHFCMGRLGRNADLTRLSELLHRAWRSRGGGRCQIEPYDQAKRGVYYILKNLDRSPSCFRESTKFVWGNGQVMISHSVWAHLLCRFPRDSKTLLRCQEVSAER